LQVKDLDREERPAKGQSEDGPSIQGAKTEGGISHDLHGTSRDGLAGNEGEEETPEVQSVRRGLQQHGKRKLMQADEEDGGGASTGLDQQQQQQQQEQQQGGVQQSAQEQQQEQQVPLTQEQRQKKEQQEFVDMQQQQLRLQEQHLRTLGQSQVCMYVRMCASVNMHVCVNVRSCEMKCLCLNLTVECVQRLAKAGRKGCVAAPINHFTLYLSWLPLRFITIQCLFPGGKVKQTRQPICCVHQTSLCCSTHLYATNFVLIVSHSYCFPWVLLVVENPYLPVSSIAYAFLGASILHK